MLQLCDLATGEHLITFPLDVGTVCGFSGKRHHTEVCEGVYHAVVLGNFWLKFIFGILSSII